MSESLIRELAATLNRASAENGSDTPDFIIATFLCDVLAAWDAAIKAREAWYGRKTAAESRDAPSPLVVL